MTTLSPDSRAPWLVAHRGARDEAPENTRAAFERALRYPIDGIELDVQLSADGVPVIYHDRTLRRVDGSRRRVHELALAELEQLDWGGWFAPRFAGEPPATLTRTLRLFGGRTRLMIEIKSDARDREAGRSERLTDAVVQLLDQARDRVPPQGVLILSFDPDVLARAASQAPRWRYVLNLPEYAPEEILTRPRRDLAHLWAVDVRIARLTEGLTQWAHDLGLRIFTYTCNGPRQLAKALALGVDAVLSDRPGWLCRQLKRS
jgi:glycerophosphoryl diester phosphodiesterase